MIQILGSKVLYSDNTYTLEGYVTFSETPNQNDYKIGFLLGKDYNNISFIPMGSYEWDNQTKQLKIITTITNAPVGGTYYFHPYIQSKSSVMAFDADAVEGEKPDIVNEPVIESQSANKSLTQPVGETITFNVVPQNVNGDAVFHYDWQYKLVDGDWNSVSNNDTGEWTTPALQVAFDGAQVRCRVYNDVGEVFSATPIIHVIEPVE